MAQIIVYAGAIMVLFLFVVMLLNAPQEDAAGWDRTHPLRRSGVGRFGALLARPADRAAGLGARCAPAAPRPRWARAATSRPSARCAQVGRVLFTDYVFAFEATSVLILVAMVGAVLLAAAGGWPVIPLGHYLIVSALPLRDRHGRASSCGRNLITILLSIEIMLNAVNLTFVAFGRSQGTVDGQIITFFVMTVAAAEAAVGLAIVIGLFRHRESLNPDAFTPLKW